MEKKLQKFESEIEKLSQEQSTISKDRIRKIAYKYTFAKGMMDCFKNINKMYQKAEKILTQKGFYKYRKGFLLYD